MAKDTHEHARTTSGTQYVVTFLGQAPITVEARTEAEAVNVAKEKLGVVSSEKDPDVVKVS